MKIEKKFRLINFSYKYERLFINNSCQDKKEGTTDIKIWYNQPADASVPDDPNGWKDDAEWLKALPLGNGSPGVMVFGDVNVERIQLNEESMRSGNPDENGKQSAFVNYYREPDLNDAVVRVKYLQDGVNFQREVFTSQPDQVMVARFTADKPGQISFSCSLTRPERFHTYSDYTQSIWNGIVGRMEMRAYDPVRIEMVRTFPDIDNDNLKVEVTLNMLLDKKTEIGYSVVSVKTGEKVISGIFSPGNTPNGEQFIFDIPVNGRLTKWSEFTPEVYSLEISMKSGKSACFFETEFGFYQVSHDGTKILINGQPVFLRGNLDCVHFPLTGYPSCEVEDWERIFRIYKDYGLNHARFHAWCPPEAAFIAANRVGIYLQAEASIWIDWWMSTDMVARPPGNGHKRSSRRGWKES